LQDIDEEGQAWFLVPRNVLASAVQGGALQVTFNAPANGRTLHVNAAELYHSNVEWAILQTEPERTDVPSATIDTPLAFALLDSETAVVGTGRAADGPLHGQFSLDGAPLPAPSAGTACLVFEALGLNKNNFQNAVWLDGQLLISLVGYDASTWTTFAFDVPSLLLDPTNSPHKVTLVSGTDGSSNHNDWSARNLRLIIDNRNWRDPAYEGNTVSLGDSTTNKPTSVTFTNSFMSDDEWSFVASVDPTACSTGIHDIAFTVTNASGMAATDHAEVWFHEREALTLGCPSDMHFGSITNLEPAFTGYATSSSDHVTLSFSDHCPAPGTEGTPLDVWTVIRTWNAETPDGAITSCVQTFTIDLPMHQWYVDASRPDDSGAATNWATAKRTLRAAADLADFGDTVWVADGTYDENGHTVSGDFQDRLRITRGFDVRSVNGPEHTTIVGASHEGTNGPTAVRCVAMSYGVLDGFTLSGGHTTVSTNAAPEYQCGGGALLDMIATVSNCVIVGCSAETYGGGVYATGESRVVNCTIENGSAHVGGGGASLDGQALLDRCIVRNNTAGGDGTEDGGGIYVLSGGHARSCLIEGNAADNGGGGIYVTADAPDALIENCTVIGNVGGYGGGMYLHGGTNRNCIIYDNTATMGTSSNWSVGSGSPEFEFCCIAPTNGLDAYGGEGCFDGDPKLRWDRSPQDGSPCRDVGSSALVTGEFDLRGRPRIMGPSVDIGAYEWIYHTPVAGFGDALEFDGADDYVNVAYHAGLNPTNAFTVEFWAYVTGGAGSYRSPVTSRNSNRGYILYAGSDDNWQFWIGSGIGYYKLRSGVPVELETWTHLAAVYDGSGTITLYVNGEVAGSPLTGVTFVANDAAPLYLGAGKTDGASPDFYFPGQLDDVRIWGAVLSANTITNWMYREVDKSHPAYTNRAGYYNLNDGSGMAAADAVYGHNGVLSGMDEAAWVDSTAGNEWEWRSLPNTVQYGKLVGSDLNGSSSDGTDWTLTFEIVTPPTNGTAMITTDNIFSYSTSRLFTEDRFTYRVRDDYGLVSNVATSRVIVLPPVPYVDITNENASVARTVTQITIGGTNSASAIGTLAWANAASESGGELPVSGSDFLIADVPLVIGANKIAVVVTNAIGEEARDSVTIERVSWHGGDSLTHYVSAGGTDVFPYTNWATAAHAIQDAVDAAAAGDTVLVTNGVYDTGGAVTPGYSLMNRVCFTRAITVRSVNGWEHTTIYGRGPRGNNAVRCVYMSGDAVLSGFTIRNGHTRTSGDLVHTRSGGGVFMDDGGLVERCRIRDNRVESDGAGVYINYEGLVRNTLIHDNEGFSGAGVYMANSRGEGPRLYNCTVVDNASDFDGGGIIFDSGRIRNCVVYYNTATTHPDTANHYSRGSSISWGHSCSLPRPLGTGNITNNPQFVSESDYQLLSASPCIDAGNNAYMPTGADFDGTPRPLDGDFDGTNTVDIGAYEYDSVTTDSDGDQASDYEEHVADTDPANPNDTFQINAISNASPVSVYFESSSNRWYTMAGCSNLLDGTWTNVPGAGPRVGVGGSDLLQDTNVPVRGPFYRLEVELP
jgi:hypothetical protein